MNIIPSERYVTHGDLETIISSFMACDDELDERIDNAARQFARAAREFTWLRDYVMCLELLVRTLTDDDDEMDTE